MESLVAQRISYLAETYNLLSDNHLGAKRRRSSVDALLVLQEEIFQAWRDKKVLSLVTFDVKGAFNGVARDVLLDRLRHRRIPKPLVKWIDDFMKDREATITVNGTATRQTALHNAGLPQGSPLSSILYIFFNADLVTSVIKKSRGSIAFVDDFSAWVTGFSIDSNISQLQSRVVPHVEGWAAKSRVIFQAKKTHLTHFTRNNRRPNAPGADVPLVMSGQTIKASPQNKILGVILDQALRYKEHISKAGDKGVKAALALKRLSNLRPETTRKLFKSKVAPAIGYASVIWAPSATVSALKRLDKAQRIRAQAITRAFSTVFWLICEAEALLTSTMDRLHAQQLSTWIKWHTKPQLHRFWKIKKTIDLANKTWISPLQKMAETFKEIQLGSLEKIMPTQKPLGTPLPTYVFRKKKLQ